MVEKLGGFKEIQFFKDIQNFSAYKDYFDEILVPHYLENAIKIINLNKKASISWYDEGMASYAPIGDDRHSRLEKKLKYVYNVEYNDKIRSFLFPKTPRKKISKKNLLEVINKATGLIEDDPGEYRREKTVILLSQYFSGINKILSEEQEVALYSDIVTGLVKKGYTVLYKEHPRTLNGFFGRIADNLGNSEKRAGFIELKFKTNYPLEFYIQKLDPLGIISVFSTSNFCVPHLFNVPSFTFHTSFFIETIEPKTHHDCFSAFTGELYIPCISLIPDAGPVSHEQAKQEVRAVFNDFQRNLPPTPENPLLKFKQIAAFNYIAPGEEFNACRELCPGELTSAIFTEEDKKFLQKIQKQCYWAYYFQKLYGSNNDIISALKRFLRFPCGFNLKVLMVKVFIRLKG